MLNFKRFLILKPLNNCSLDNASCVAKIVSDNNETTISLEILSTKQNLSVCGEIDGEVYHFSNENSLKLKKTVNWALREGVSVVLYDSIAFLPIAYADYGKVIFSPEQIVNSVKKNTCLNYDDDVIASENYYKGDFNEDSSIFIDPYDRYNQDKKIQTQTQTQRRTILYENPLRNSYGERFYEKVKPKFDELFSSHPKDLDLCGLIPNSNFAKISYDKERFYSVGCIEKDDSPLYFCYAVPGNYSNSPKELKPYCRFIPSSPFNPLGNGYFIIFQSALTGEILTE